MRSIGVTNINPSTTEEHLCALSLKASNCDPHPSPLIHDSSPPLEALELFSAIIMWPLVYLLLTYSLRAVNYSIV